MSDLSNSHLQIQETRTNQISEFSRSVTVSIQQVRTPKSELILKATVLLVTDIRPHFPSNFLLLNNSSSHNNNLYHSNNNNNSPHCLFQDLVKVYLTRLSTESTQDTGIMQGENNKIRYLKQHYLHIKLRDYTNNINDFVV